MYKIRYEIETGKVNLITSGKEVPEVEGHKIIEVKERPEFDSSSEHLYYKDGKFEAVKAV